LTQIINSLGSSFTVNIVRTVSDAKRDFYKAFPKPINSIYRRVVDELLVEIHLLTVNQKFSYDPIFALGVVTAFDRFTVGYQPESDLVNIFSSLSQALVLNPEQMRQEAGHLTDLATRSPAGIKDLLTTLESNADLEPLAAKIPAIASNSKFKYSRLFAVGLFTLLEIAVPDDIADSTKRQELINQVGTTLQIGADRLSKDIDLYRSNLEKILQTRQMMADMVEAERKKRENQTKKLAETTTVTPEPVS
jgi:photosystem II biogenesis protein Psp29